MSWTKATLSIFLITSALFLSVDYTFTAFNLYPQDKKLTELIFEGEKLRKGNNIYSHGFTPKHYGKQVWSNKLYEVCTDQNSFKISCSNFSNEIGKNFDIAFIGDSFTEAIGMEYEDSFVGMFAADKSEFHVANLGVSSYSPSIYYAKLKHLIANGYKFNHIFIFIDISDIQDEAKYLYKNGSVHSYIENKWENKKNDAIYDVVTDDFYLGLSKHLKLTAVLYSLINYQEIRPASYKIPARHPRGEWTYNDASLAYGQIGVSGAIKKSLDMMEKTYDLLSANDIKMSIGVYPWPNQIFNDKLINNLQSDIWKDFCKNKCEYFVDVFADYSGLVNSASPFEIYNKYFILGDVHFNKAGNKLVYEAIKRSLGEGSELAD